MNQLKQKVQSTALFTPQEKIEILVAVDTFSDDDKIKLETIIDEYDAKHKKITGTFKAGMVEELDGIVRDARPEDQDRVVESVGKIKAGMDVVIPN